MTCPSKMAQKREFLPVGASAKVGVYKLTPNARRDFKGIFARTGGFSKNQGKSGRESGGQDGAEGKAPLPRGNGGQVTNRPTPLPTTNQPKRNKEK